MSEVFLKNIEQKLEYDKKCYLLTYELNDNVWRLKKKTRKQLPFLKLL